MSTTSQQQPSILHVLACFAALRDHKERKPTKPLSQWKRKGIPRTIWCGSKTVFDQREAAPNAFLDETGEIHSLEKPKRKYVKKTPEEKAALALKPKRKYTKKGEQPAEIPPLFRSMFTEPSPAKPKRKYVKKTAEEKAALALKPKRKYTKKTAEEKAIATLKPIIAQVIANDTLITTA